MWLKCCPVSSLILKSKQNTVPKHFETKHFSCQRHTRPIWAWKWDSSWGGEEVVGEHLRQAGDGDQEQGRETHLQIRGQRHPDWDLYWENLPENVHVTTNGHSRHSQSPSRGCILLNWIFNYFYSYLSEDNIHAVRTNHQSHNFKTNIFRNSEQSCDVSGEMKLSFSHCCGLFYDKH